MGNKPSHYGGPRGENDRSYDPLGRTSSVQSINPFVRSIYGAPSSYQVNHDSKSNELPEDALMDSRRSGKTIFSLPTVMNKEGSSYGRVNRDNTKGISPTHAAIAGNNQAASSSCADNGKAAACGREETFVYTKASEDNSTITSSKSTIRDTRYRLSVNQAKEYFSIIFSPPVGELEVMACGAITQETYGLLGSFLALLLRIKQRERWYVDPVMIATLGLDARRLSAALPGMNVNLSNLNRFASHGSPTDNESNSSSNDFEDSGVRFGTTDSTNSDFIGDFFLSVPNKLNKQQVHQLNVLRAEYNNMLRDRLIMIGNCNSDMSPSFCENALRTLKRVYECFVMKSVSEQEHNLKMLAFSFEQEMSKWTTQTASLASRGRAGIADAFSKSKESANGSYPSANAAAERKYCMDALHRTAKSSFFCLQILGECIPPALIDRLPADYLFNTSPVLDARLSLIDRCLDDIENRSFFVTLAQRIARMNGEVNSASSYDMHRHTNEIKKNLSMTDLFVESTETPKAITTIRDFHIAMRNLSLLLTTAFSSMIIYVLINIAETARLRSYYRKLFEHNSQIKLPMKEFFSGVCAGLDIFLGEPDEADLKQMLFVITDEMSMTVFTRLLLKNYRRKHSAQANQLKARFHHLRRVFGRAHLVGENEDLDVARLMGSIALKLMFLIGGGTRSIQADDRRPPLGDLRTVDDIALSHLLEVPLLSRICWVACILGMPVASQSSVSANSRLERPFIFAEADECVGVMRELFQSVGALPLGPRCPSRFINWLPIFPLYAVGLEGKRILLYLYSVQSCGVRPLELMVQKDMMLLSFAEALKKSFNFSRRERANYIFKPKFIVGDSRSSISTMSAHKSSKSSSNTATGGESSNHAHAAASSHNNDKQSGTSQTWTSTKLAKTSFNPSKRFSKKDLPSWAQRGECVDDNENNNNNENDGNAIDSSDSNTHSDINEEEDATNTKARTSNEKIVSDEEQEEKDADSSSFPSHKDDAVLDDKATDPSAVDPDELSQHTLTPSISSSGNTGKKKGNEYNFSMLSLNSTFAITRPSSMLRMIEPNRVTDTAILDEHSEDLPHTRKPSMASASDASLSSSSSSSSLSSFSSEGSDLLSGEVEVDVYTCVSAQEQLYLRCSNEATVRRHKATELTPFVRTQMYNSTVILTRVYPEMRRAIRAQIPILLPNEHLLVLHWIYGEPTVTLRNGDYLPVLVKCSTPACTNFGPGKGDSSNTNSRGEMYDHIRNSLTQNLVELSSSTIRSDNPLLANPAVSYQLEANMLLDMTLRDLTQMIETNNNTATKPTSSRFGTCFTIVQIVSCHSAFASPVDPADRSCTAADLPGVLSGEGHANERLELTSADVILHIKTSGLGSHDQFEVINIGHERASMSPFYMIDNSKTVCWANPHLLTALLSGGAGEATNGRRDAPLCHTITELHGVFFSIGVLLANSIANGVFLHIPLPPLLFALIKKALITGDYNFDNVMWLEPCDGNLLSPTTILNSAYAILTMSDNAYYEYIKKRGLCHLIQGNIALRNSHSDLGAPDRLCESSMFGKKTIALNKLGLSQTLASAQNIYMSDMQKYSDVPVWPQQEFFYDSKEGGNETETPLYQNKGKRYVDRLKQRTRTAVESFAEHFIEGRKGGGDRLRVLSNNNNNTYYELPSRAEYIVLYLVNELAWSSVSTENMGSQTKDLWVSFLRGFMTSPMAKSPLFSHCCSRVVREVLCVPPKQKAQSFM